MIYILESLCAVFSTLHYLVFHPGHLLAAHTWINGRVGEEVMGLPRCGLSYLKLPSPIVCFGQRDDMRNIFGIIAIHKLHHRIMEFAIVEIERSGRNDNCLDRGPDHGQQETQ